MIPVVDGYINLVCFLKEHFPKLPLVEISEEECDLEPLICGQIRIMISAFTCPDSQNGPGTSSNFLAGLLSYAQNYMDILPVLNSSKHLAQVMGRNGLPAVIQLLENADALLEWDLLDLWHQGFRAVGLTHDGANRIGDGYQVRNPQGLSSVGRKLMRRLSESGFVLDLARLSEPSFYQVVQCYTGALLVSHTGLQRFYDIPRNLSDEQVRIIMDRGGIIGLSFAPQLLCADHRAGVWDLFTHLDCLVQQYGPDQIAVSSGFQGNRDRANGLSVNSLDFQRLAALLHEYGYPRNAIAKIMGRNWSEFYALHLDRNRFYERLNQ